MDVQIYNTKLAFYILNIIIYVSCTILHEILILNLNDNFLDKR